MRLFLTIIWFLAFAPSMALASYSSGNVKDCDGVVRNAPVGTKCVTSGKNPSYSGGVFEERPFVSQPLVFKSTLVERVFLEEFHELGWMDASTKTVYLDWNHQNGAKTYWEASDHCRLSEGDMYRSLASLEDYKKLEMHGLREVLPGFETIGGPIFISSTIHPLGHGDFAYGLSLTGDIRSQTIKTTFPGKAVHHYLCIVQLD